MQHNITIFFCHFVMMDLKLLQVQKRTSKPPLTPTKKLIWKEKFYLFLLIKTCSVPKLMHFKKHYRSPGNKVLDHIPLTFPVSITIFNTIAVVSQRMESKISDFKNKSTIDDTIWALKIPVNLNFGRMNECHALKMKKISTKLLSLKKNAKINSKMIKMGKFTLTRSWTKEYLKFHSSWISSSSNMSCNDPLGQYSVKMYFWGESATTPMNRTRWSWCVSFICKKKGFVRKISIVAI